MQPKAGMQSPIRHLLRKPRISPPQLLKPCPIMQQAHHVSTSHSATATQEPAGPAGHGTNRLAKEQSPYLLQHQHNPVDWYPWGPEAIEKARAEDKPIFLSVGYSSCHWCHVMERESFEDQETADLLNKHFVSIKVDREERPDVDRLYMTYVQAVSGRGGWPMSVWMTPDLDPLYGGTYYPKKDIIQGGYLAMPAFTTILRRLANLWETNREDLKAKGTSVMSQLRQQLLEESSNTSDTVETDLAAHALETVQEQLAKRFDSKLGGFGGAPKFPRPSEITALFAAHVMHKGRGQHTAADQALHMALFSLDKMAAGGMYDHIGGGFHRYSVDEYWHVPHFEKMLYDAPPLAMAYLSALQLTDRHAYALTARGVLDYLRRELRAQEGGLYSAEDADSYNPDKGHKTEGFFYIWAYDEVQRVLGGGQQAALFCEAYNIKPEGNCTLSAMSDPHEEFVGYNVPILLHPLQDLAAKHELTLDELEAQLAVCRQALFDVRCQRTRPGLDDKIVSAWNGMAISAFALASRALTGAQPLDPGRSYFPVQGAHPHEYLAAAQSIAQFVKDYLWDTGSRTLRRSYCKGVAQVEGFADDYANVIAGCLDLYEAGGGLQWLQWAVQLQDRMDELFWAGGTGGGGYFSTSTSDPSIKLRIKDSYDGAEPSASSVAGVNLYRLASLLPTATPTQAEAPQAPTPAGAPITAEAAAAAASPQTELLTYGARGERTLGAFQERLFESPIAMTHMCSAALLMLNSPLRQVIIASGQHTESGLSSPAAQALLDAAHVPYVPDKVVILIDLSDSAQMEFWQQNNPEALNMVTAHYDKQPSAGPTAFICQNYMCQTPTEDPDKVVQLLRGGASGTAAPGQAPKLKPVTGLPGL